MSGAQRWAGGMVSFSLTTSYYFSVLLSGRSRDECAFFVVKSSRSLCTVRRLFATPGDTLPASLPLGSKITPVTFRRRINSYIVWDQWDLWGLSAAAWDHTHTCRRFCSSLNAVAHLYIYILPTGCLPSLLYPSFYLDLWWARLRLLERCI